MYKRGFVMGLCVVLLASLVFALNVGKKSNIEQNYGTGENLAGQVNISLSNDLASGKFKAIFEKTGYSEEKFSNLTIKEIFDLQDVNYVCKPDARKCYDEYSLSNKESEKSIDISAGDEKIVAFKFSGRGTVFESMAFSIDVNNSESCNNPLQIDLLDDGIIDWQATKMTDKFTCAEETGCFDTSASTDRADIGTAPYCEKVTLPASSKFKLGAWVKKGSNPTWDDVGVGLLTMALYSIDGSELDSCELDEPSTSGGLIDCIIDDYENTEEQDFFVCIYASQNTNYEIKYEDEEPICGISAYPSSNNVYEHDFYIYASTPKYDKIGAIDESSFDDIDNKIEDYISDVYNNNCTSGCKIPMRFIAGSDTTINISNIDLAYSDTLRRHEESVWDAQKEPLRLDTNYSIVRLDAIGISTPQISGNYDMRLYLNDNLINRTRINVTRFMPIVGVYPSLATLKTETTFQVVLKQAYNVSSYFWNFGDGTILTTTENRASHAYNGSGTYTMKVSVVISGKNYSGEFSINVMSARDSANATLARYQNNLNFFERQIGNLSSWAQTAIKEQIGFSDMNSKILSLKQRYLAASSETQFLAILNNLSEMRVPSSINIISQPELPYYLDYNLIDIAKLSRLGAGATADKQKISSWLNNNFDLKIEFKILNLVYDDGEENLGSLVKLKLAPKVSQTGKLYVVIDGASSFKDTGWQNMNDSFGAIFSDVSAKEIEFLNYDAASLQDIRVHIAPEFSKLAIEVICNANGVCEKGLGENKRTCPQDCGSIWTNALLTVLIIIVLGVGAWLGIVWWYRMNYEKRLFKEKSELFNIMNFRKAGKEQGLERKQIIEELKKQGWNTEQIGYGFMQVEESIFARL
ncbi:MAG: PKD domain-containing protein, partial [Candidatus Aenigmatarchaeota archaeon]